MRTVAFCVYAVLVPLFAQNDGQDMVVFVVGAYDFDSKVARLWSSINSCSSLFACTRSSDG